ncbi:MAG: M50 family metallopeptidase [Oscillospiraceae bacterium]
MQIVFAIIAFCFIILIHELGHFVAAKLSGIQVNEFSIGMGPVLFRWGKGETKYSFRLLPIGGFVSMEGEDGSSDNPRAFNRRPIWKRMIVILAGAIMNLILGFFVTLGFLGTCDDIATTTVSGFRGSSVSSSQLNVGDKITAIDGLPIFTSSDIVYKLQNSDTKNEAGNLTIDITVLRNGEKVLLKDVEFATKLNEDGTGSVYLDFTVLPMERTFVNMISESFRESLSIGRIIIMTLVDMLRGKYGINDLSGPVGVVQVVSETIATQEVWLPDFLYLFAFLTINVGVFNLLPIPALDGCRFLFLIIEAIRRKPLKPETEGMVHFVGFAVLMLLMLVVTFNDVAKLFVGG